jgi:ankyrin repeat protein
MRSWVRWDAFALVFAINILAAGGCLRSHSKDSDVEHASLQLVEAIRRDDLAQARKLIAAEHGWRPVLDPDGKLHLPGGRYFFPVHLAAREGSDAILEELLCDEVRREVRKGGMQGVDEMKSDLQGLMRAGRLLRAGALIDARDEEGQTPIMWICAYRTIIGPHNEARQLRCLRLLAQAGADLEAKTAWYGHTALHRSARVGDAAYVKELIALGANVNSRAANGNTPLHEGCTTLTQEGRLTVVKLLVEAGADPNAKNRDGKTPAQYALEHQPDPYPDVLPLLTKKK